MAREEDQLVFDVRPQTGSVFTASGKRVFDNADPVPGALTFNATNAAGKWIDIVVESYYPYSDRLWTSGRMENGQASHLATDLKSIIDRAGGAAVAIHITRWAPGFLGIPGSGGGEVYFVLPTTGDVTVDIRVTG